MHLTSPFFVCWSRHADIMGLGNFTSKGSSSMPYFTYSAHSQSVPPSSPSAKGISTFFFFFIENQLKLLNSSENVGGYQVSLDKVELKLWVSSTLTFIPPIISLTCQLRKWRTKEFQLIGDNIGGTKSAPHKTCLQRASWWETQDKLIKRQNE